MQIGIKLLEILEKIHIAGYVYNQIALKNIVLGSAH